MLICCRCGIIPTAPLWRNGYELASHCLSHFGSHRIDLGLWAAGTVRVDEQPAAGERRRAARREHFNVPAGEDAEAAQDLIQQYLSEFSDEENWPEDLAEVKIDVPLLQTFPVDLTQNEQVAAAADKLEAVAVDNLEGASVPGELDQLQHPELSLLHRG